MNDNPRANGSRGRDPYAALRLIALIAAIVGVIVLAAAAFVLSYDGIHKIALSAGVSPSVARIFPVIFDAMLVVSCAAVVSLRSAGWWPRTYSWLSTLALLAVVAAADAAQATGTHLPRKPAAATVAVLPWALLLLAFSLLLSMLRQFRRTRSAAADAAAASAAWTPPRRYDFRRGRPPAARPGRGRNFLSRNARSESGPRGRLPRFPAREMAASPDPGPGQPPPRSRPGKWQPPPARPGKWPRPAREVATSEPPRGSRLGPPGKSPLGHPGKQPPAPARPGRAPRP